MGFGGEDVACAGAEGAADGGQGRRLFGGSGSEAPPSYSVEDVGADVHCWSEGSVKRSCVKDVCVQRMACGKIYAAS